MAKNEADSKTKTKAAKNEKSKKGGLKKYLKDLKSEMKKVVWPNRKHVINNTGVVMSVMVAVGLFLFAIDTGLAAVIKALLSIGS